MALTPQDVLAESQGTTPITASADATVSPLSNPLTADLPYTANANTPLVGSLGVSPSLRDQLIKTGYPAPKPTSPGTAALAAQTADTLAANNPNPSKPGAWAKALVGGMQSAIAGLGDAGAIGKVPEGAGALYGISKTIQARNERLMAQKAQADKEKQQQFENKLATNRDTREQEMADYERFARQIQTERSIREMDDDDQNYMAAQADKQIKSNEANGGRPLQSGMNSDKIAEYAKANHSSPDDPNGTHWLKSQPIYQDGWEMVYGPDGKPVKETDQWGHETGEQRRPTFTLMTWGNPRTVDADFVAEAKKYAPQTPLQEGQILDPQQARFIETQIGLGKAQELAMKKTLLDAGKTDADLDKLKQNQDFQTALPIWLHWMNDAKGDPQLAMHNLEQHAEEKGPQTGQLNPEAVAQYQAIVKGLGPQIVKSELDSYEKTQVSNAKAQIDKSSKNPMPTGDVNLTGDAYLQSVINDPEGGKGEAALIRGIADASYPIGNWSYILARASSPIAKEVSVYDRQFNGALLQNFPKHYADFENGKAAQILLAGGTAADALKALKDIMDIPGTGNVPSFLVPGTKANREYNVQLTNTVGELAKYLYGPGKAQEKETEDLRKALIVHPYLFTNIDAGVIQQAKAIQKRYSELQQLWVNGLPSPKWVAAYQMPGLRPDTMRVLQKLAGEENPKQPGYRPGVPTTAPTNPITPNYAKPTATPAESSSERLKQLNINPSTLHINPETHQTIGWNGSAYIDITTGQPVGGTK